MFKAATLCSIAALLLLPQVATAQVRLSGFGQVVGGTTTEEGTTLSGYDSDVDFRNGSLFAVQISSDLSERITATGQIVAKGSDDFDPKFAWAYLKFQATPEVSFIAGRQRNPLFRYSDFLDVGYAYPWVTPPQSVYNLGVDNVDGISMAWARNSGKWYSLSRVLFASFDGKAGPRGETAKLDPLVSLSWELTYDGWLTTRASYMRTDLTLEAPQLNSLLASLRQAGLTRVAGEIDVVDSTGVFQGLGVEIDRGNWFVLGEYTRLIAEDDVFLADADNSYVAAGLRLSGVTPYVLLGRREADPKTNALALLPSTSPFRPAVSAVATSASYDDTYLGAGVRWDFSVNVAGKLDYTRFQSDVSGRRDTGLITAGLVFTF